jgi:molybdate transport system substrate-binding protein
MKFAKRRWLMLVMVMVLTGMGLGFAIENGLAAEGEVVVFAAASTTNAITEIGDLFEAKGLGQITTSFASSSTLAKQIASGAPVNVFISANEKWMNFLAEKNLIEKGTRFDLLGNRIVVIAPLQSSIQTVDVKKGLDLAALLGNGGRLSTGDPEHVPAGMYGKKAMESLGLWDQVKDHLAPMKDVRAALVMVERAEAPLGLVYATDAAISKKVRVVGTFPVESHPPIVYPVTSVAGQNTDATARFLDFLKNPQSRGVFEKYGFEVR